MKLYRPVAYKYLGIGFACLIIATALLRAADALEWAPAVAGAIMLSLVVSSIEETHKA